ncbi:uncharacterized protein B0I36DRAFT_274320, partial [Microdochium trichocladiopsis]
MPSKGAAKINSAGGVTASGNSKVHIGDNYHIRNHDSTPEPYGARLRADLLQSLRTCHYRERKDRNPERAQGTCEWFTAHQLFRRWLAQSSALLWVSADPGCGKSVLTRHLVDNVLPSDKETLCYFFFKDDFEDQKTMEGALCCILHQLFTQRPGLMTDNILKRVREAGSRLLISFDALWDILIEAAHHHQTTSPEKSSIVCVMDALDECSNGTLLMQALTKPHTTTRIPGLKFLITSRPYGQMRAGFQGLGHIHPTIHLSGESEEEVNKIEREIAIVIQQRIEQIGQRFSLPAALRRELATKMSNIKNRTYLWVYLVFADLEESDKLSLDDFRRTIDRIPPGINEAYDKILRRSGQVDKVRQILHLVLAAEKPLHLREMATALAFRSESHRTFSELEKDVLSTDQIKVAIREACGLFVIVIDDHVFLMHQTAKEFLLRPKNTSTRKRAYDLTWHRSFDMRDSHNLLAETCINYLMLIDAEPPHSYIPAFRSWRDMSRHKLELLDYAALNWTIHFRRAQRKIKDSLVHWAYMLCQAEGRACQVWLGLFADTPVKPHPLLLAGFLGLTRLLRPIFLSGSKSPEERTMPDGRTSLSWASEKGYIDFVEELLKQVRERQSFWRKHFRRLAIVNFADKEDRTPLWHAAANRQWEVVDVLLQNGAKVNVADKYGVTALSWADHHGDDRTAALLTSHGARLPDFKAKFREIMRKDGVAPLIKAASQGRESIVRLLVEQGADLESRDHNSRTALMWASHNGHMDTVALLVDNGSEIDAHDKYGFTALFCA